MVDPIAGLKSDSGSLISVYVNRPSPGGFAALLSDLVRPLRERSAGSDRPVAKAIRSDLERIRDLAPRFELESVPGYAIFASAIDDLFVVESLGHEVPNRATFGPMPYLRPLRAASRPLRSGILVADSVSARVFLGIGGQVEEVGEALASDIGRPSYGGFAGYEEQSARQRALEATFRMWKEAGHRLLELHEGRPFDYLVLGGHDEMLEDLAGRLHPYLGRLPRLTFAATPGSLSPAGLRAEVTAFDEKMRRERQSALAGRVCDTAWSGGNAVLGLTSVLHAANARAIDRLVVAGEFARPGTMCQRCSHLSRDGRECPVCGSATFELDDVVAAVMESVVASGGTVHQIVVASPVDSAGVGALTRFPVSV